MRGIVHFTRSNPFSMLLLPLMIGILVGVYTQWVISLHIFPLALFFLILFPKQKLKFRWIWGVYFLGLWILIGIWTVHLKREQKQPPKHLTTHYVKAVVKGVPQEKKTKLLIPLTICNISTNDSSKLIKATFDILAYTPKKETIKEWRYGDTIYTQITFTKIRHNTNPHAFDYARMLNLRQIYYNGYLSNGSIIKKKAQSLSLFRLAQQVQKQLSEQLGNYIEEPKTRSFLQALTLGDRKNIDPTVKIDFVNTGVVHILAVSGLHVGILFLMLNLLLQPFKTTKLRRFLITIIGLLIIWGFAFISGLSISVIRAAIMFSGLQMSLVSLRPYKTYNTLAYSAVFLLLYNPFNLLEVGFQLSYIAVIGIITLNPLLNRIQWKYKTVNKFQQMISVSLAAQLSLLPITLFYFHQLPTYFLLANIVILFFAPFLLGGSLLLLLLSFIPVIARFIGFIFCFLGETCLFIINKMATLPHPILFQYIPNLTEVFLWYGVLLSLYLYYRYRKVQYWYFLLLFIFGSFSINYYHTIQNEQQQTFIVHDIRKQSCYTILSHNNGIVLSSDTLSATIKRQILSPLFIKKEIRQTTYFQLFQNDDFTQNRTILIHNHFLWNNKHIVFADKMESPTISFKDKIKVDLLIFSNRYTQTDIMKYIAPKEIILDSSISSWQRKKLKDALLHYNLPLYDIASKGTFIKEFY